MIYVYFALGFIILGGFISKMLNYKLENIIDWFRRLKLEYYDKESFYIEKFTKTVTVYDDCFAIVVSCYDIRILNDKINNFSRYMSLVDSPNDTIFPLPLNDYENTSINERFSKFGWWWECSVNGLIKKVDTSSSNAKRASFNFLFDTDKIKDEKIKKCRIIFSVSMPALYKDCRVISGTEIKYRTDEFIFQMGILKTLAVGQVEFEEIKNGTDDSIQPLNLRDKLIKLPDNFYTKYSFVKIKPTMHHKYRFKIDLTK